MVCVLCLRIAKKLALAGARTRTRPHALQIEIYGSCVSTLAWKNMKIALERG